MKIVKDTPSANALIIKMLLAAQGHAKARTLTLECIHNHVKHAEKMLADKGLPKRVWRGSVYRWGAPQMPKSYKYQAASTVLSLVRCYSGWAILNLTRTHTWPVPYGNPRSAVLKLTPAALTYLLMKSEYNELVNKMVGDAFAAGKGSAKLVTLATKVAPQNDGRQLNMHFI